MSPASLILVNNLPPLKSAVAASLQTENFLDYFQKCVLQGWLCVVYYYYCFRQRSNGVCDFITRGLIWCSVPIFSTLLDYWDLMESQTAEFAPLHLRWTHCSIHLLCLHNHTSPVLPLVDEWRKWHQINCTPWMNEAMAFGVMPRTRDA